jgi:hypothetical protein
VTLLILESRINDNKNNQILSNLDNDRYECWTNKQLLGSIETKFSRKVQPFSIIRIKRNFPLSNFFHISRGLTAHYNFKFAFKMCKEISHNISTDLVLGMIFILDIRRTKIRKCIEE